MESVICVVLGLALGLYAGKKRERGDCWGKICSDLCYDVVETAKAAWTKVSGPFRKGASKSEKPLEEPEDAVEA